MLSFQTAVHPATRSYTPYSEYLGMNRRVPNAAASDSARLSRFPSGRGGGRHSVGSGALSET